MHSFRGKPRNNPIELKSTLHAILNEEETNDFFQRMANAINVIKRGSILHLSVFPEEYISEFLLLADEYKNIQFKGDYGDQYFEII